jgi:geranylgeranyl pyrophosphate synthase
MEMAFETYYVSAKEKIDNRIQDILKESNTDRDLRSMLTYGLDGGKRLRPALCLLMADMLNGNRDRALNHAAIVELIHASSLVHDDIIEEDPVRRGMPSVWKLLSKIPWIGPKELDPRNLAVLVGDGMWAVALNLVEDTRAMKAVTECMKALVDGAFKEGHWLLRSKFLGTTEEEYLAVIVLKTGSLFSVSTHLGALASDEATEDQIEWARQVGLKLGIIYQLADDIADGGAPRGVKVEDMLIDHASQYEALIDKFPEGPYREMMREVMYYSVNSMLEEEKSRKRLRRNGTGFVWFETVNAA